MPVAEIDVKLKTPVFSCNTPWGEGGTHHGGGGTHHGGGGTVGFLLMSALRRNACQARLQKKKQREIHLLTYSTFFFF